MNYNGNGEPIILENNFLKKCIIGIVIFRHRAIFYIWPRGDRILKVATVKPVWASQA